MSYKGSPFPQVSYKEGNIFFLNFTFSKYFQVAEKIQEELEDYRSKEEDIKKMKHDMGIDTGSENDAAIGMLSDNTQVG